MQLSIELKDYNTIMRFKNLEARLNINLLNAIRKACRVVRDQIVRNLTTGKYNVKTDTGRLRASMTYDVRPISDGSVLGRVGTNVIYARIQESGGTTRPTVTPRMARFAWAQYKETGLTMWKAIALKKGDRLNIKIPPHWYMRNTMREMKNRVKQIVMKGILNK